jgi:1-deoxy-D-xylulose-5-phosphate synthase
VINERDGEVLIVNFGALIEIAEEVAIEQNATLLDMRFVKPMDEELLAHHSKNKTLIVTIEDGAVAGGAGSAVSEWSQHQAIKTPVLICGIPDAFIEHATRTQMIKMAGLDAPSILLKIKNYLS